MTQHPHSNNTKTYNYIYYQFRWFSLLLFSALSTGCAMLAPAPPANQSNICEIFREQPRWYDYAKSAEEKWGTPIATQMAFIKQESSFRSHVRPPRKKLLGFIPWSRPSSAYGYPQAQNPVWGEYLDDVGSPLARRTHMKYATDFVGWYNRRSNRMVNISLDNPSHLYLAYHEGQTGYRRGSYQNKPAVVASARRVGEVARQYSSQLSQCEQEFQCRRFYQIGPFCQR